MRTYIARFLIAGILLTGTAPIIASAQSTGTDFQSQLTQITTVLTQILSQIDAAAALGSTYASSPAYQTQVATWTQTLTQLQVALSAIVSQASQSPSSAGTSVPVNLGYCPSLSLNLTIGMRGTEVAELQRFLQAEPSAQYAGQANGLFDPATQAAVERFQTAQGIVSYGSPETTGFGRAGSLTRTAISEVCSNRHATTAPPTLTYATSGVPVSPVQPIVIPTLPAVPAQPTVSQYSTGSVSVHSVPGSDVKSASFTVTANANASCSTTMFTLAFGDGAQQQLAFPASCASQVQPIYHVYSQSGPFSAVLSSGSFTTSLAFTIPLPGSGTPASASISSVSGSGNGSVIVTLTVIPGTACTSAPYTVDFGDGTQQTLTFPFSSVSCGTQTQTATHAYSLNGTYTIRATDASGNAQTTSFIVNNVTAAGAGDPFAVLALHAEGANNSTAITDESPSKHAMTAYRNAHIDTTSPIRGTSSMAFDGAGDYVSTPSSNDFNFASGAFTVDFWFKARSFPASNRQASLMQQANSGATDASLGGAGLELFGNQLYFVGNIGGVVYHPFYGNSISTAALSANTWYHAALVRSGNIVTLYLNGTGVASTTVSGSANASGSALTFGRYGEFDGNYFNGYIDDVDVARGTARWTSNFDTTTLNPITPSAGSTNQPGRCYTFFQQILCSQ